MSGSASLTRGILWGSPHGWVYDVCGTTHPVRPEGLLTTLPTYFLFRITVRSVGPCYRHLWLLPFLKTQSDRGIGAFKDRKSTRLNSSHVAISYAVFCLKKKIIHTEN